MAGGFQTQVADQPALGVAGDFASANPHSTYDAGPGGLVAGTAGVTIGVFAWTTSPLDANAGPTRVNNFGAGSVAGFVQRLQQGSNSVYLSNAGMTILGGYPVNLATGGDFLCVNSGSGQALRGMKAYANFLTGAVTFAASGAPTTASSTSSTIAAGTAATFTGSITGNILTIPGVVTNTIFAGAVLTGGTVATNTTIVSQISGTTGGTGSYYVDIPEQTVASAALTATPSVLDTTGGTVTGTIGIGSVVQSAGGSVTGTVVGMSVSAAYATGKWVLTRAPFVAVGSATSGAIVTSNNVETPWYALNSALSGEIIKIGAPVTSFGSQLS